MKFHTTYILIFFLGLLVSCQENELDPLYKGDSRVVLSGDEEQGARQDSILFSFAIFNEEVQEMDIQVQVQTLGNLSSRAQVVRLEMDPELTSANDSEYSFPETVTIAPGSVTATAPVTIKRVARLKESETKLVVRVVANEDFLPGPHVPGDLVNAGPSFAIVWNDQFTKPAYWDPAGLQSVRWVWGDWSRTKHQLIVDLTGITDFSELTTAQKYNIQSLGLAYLVENGPIKNEFGREIGFCSNCN